MKVLVACEESQAVCKAFRERGHEAYSCDIQECSGGHPEWHIKQDVLEILSPKDQGNNYLEIWFYTTDGQFHSVKEWDLIIAHPPCTYLTNTGNRWYNIEKYGDAALGRQQSRELSVDFFMEFVYAECKRVAIENPIGCMSSVWRKPDQIIHPYYFAEFQGDENCERKATCLWLKGLPPLVYEKKYEPRVIKYKNGKGTDSPWHMETMKLPKDERSRARSKTFPGIAKAMAEQWG